MMKRGKKLHITIDSLPTDLENGKIMNGNSNSSSGSSSSSNTASNGVNNRNITSLIGIGIAFRRRKNFSVILFVGLSALLCALYYTSYYPGAVWTLRLGVTPFGSHTSGSTRNAPASDGQQQKAESSALTGSATRINVNHGTTANKNGEKILPSAGDGQTPGGSSSGTSNSQVISASMSNINDEGGGGTSSGSNHLDDGDQVGSKTDKSGSNPNNGNSNAHGEGGESADEISTPKTWNWKYWASLEYWKVNLTRSAGGDDDDDDGVDELPHSLSEQPAGRGSPSVSANLVTTGGSRVASSGGTKTMVKVGETTRSNGGERLSCNFPRLNPFDPSITEFIKSPPAIDCRKIYPLVFRTNFRNKLIQCGNPFPSSTTEEEQKEGGVGSSDKVANFNCCYKTITRGNGSDHNVIFSKRCYPIISAETEISAAHEFISVRCRRPAGGSNQATHNNKGPSTTHRSNTSSSSTSNGDNNNNGNNASTGSSNNNNRTRVYKDMLAFVPLKPLVEDRIRKYEESKRKSLYTHKKRNSNKESKRKENDPLLVNNRESINFLSEHELNHESQKRGDGSAAASQDLHEILTGNEDRLSVLVLGLDAQSHMNFIRQMPQTYNFLVKNLSAVGMYGYTKVGDNTFPNVVTLLSGLSVDELILRCWPTKDSYFDSCPFIWKKFAESGYRTSLAEDSVWMGTFNYEKRGFLQPPTDYYLHPLSLLMAKKIGHETWANAKLCYGPRLAFEVLLDYIVKTAVTFRDSLYFQFVWANSLFHDYLNNPRLGDELLYMTLEYLRNNGYLNNTALILLSDHGIRWGSIRSTYQGKIEERMPLAYFAFPHWFRRKYPKAFRNLGRNVLRLTTPFDVHETLKDILRVSRGEKVRFDRWSNNDEEQEDEGGGSNDNKGNGEYIKSSGDGGGPPNNGGNNAGDEHRSESESGDEKPPRGISLFRRIPLQRTCKQAGIEEHWCVCHSMQSVPINSTLVHSGAQFIVQVINGLVRKHSGFCAKLVLFKINEAKRKIDGDIDRGLDIDFRFPALSSSTTGSRNSSSAAIAATGGSSNDEAVVPTGTFPNPYNEHTSGRGSPLGGGGNKRDITKKSGKSGAYRHEKTDKVSNGKKSAVTSSSFRRVKRDEDILTSLSTSSDIKKMIQLQLVIVTTPGNAVFEATIYGEAEIVNRPVNDQDIDQEAGERSNHHWKLSGDISRLNLYGSQSACVTDYTVQKYCYCHSLEVD